MAARYFIRHQITMALSSLDDGDGYSIFDGLVQVRILSALFFRKLYTDRVPTLCMEILSYNWGNEYTNQVGICLKDSYPSGTKLMVWCDEDDYEIEGFASDKLSREKAQALGEALYQMLDGYR